jgi:hypothetical protein
VVSATQFQFMFSSCIRVRLQPNVFGPDPNRFLNTSPNFTSAFVSVGIGAGTAQGTAPELWNYNFGTGTPTRTNAFAGSNSTSLSNWAQIPIAWGGPA